MKQCKAQRTKTKTLLSSFTVHTRPQRDSWYWYWKSRLGQSRPGIGLGLDRILKPRQVLVLVSFKNLSQDKSWYWSWLKTNIKTSIGLGLEWKLKSRLVLVLVLKGLKFNTISRHLSVYLNARKNDFVCYSNIIYPRILIWM